MKQFSGLIFILFAVFLFGANASSLRTGHKKAEDRNDFFVSDQGFIHRDDNFVSLSFIPSIEIQKKPVKH